MLIQSCTSTGITIEETDEPAVPDSEGAVITQIDAGSVLFPSGEETGIAENRAGITAEQSQKIENQVKQYYLNQGRELLNVGGSFQLFLSPQGEQQYCFALSVDENRKIFAHLFRVESGGIMITAETELLSGAGECSVTVYRIPTHYPLFSVSFDNNDYITWNLCGINEDSLEILSNEISYSELFIINDVDDDGFLDIVYSESRLEEGLGLETYISFYSWYGSYFHKSRIISVVRKYKHFLTSISEMIRNSDYDSLFNEYSDTPFSGEIDMFFAFFQTEDSSGFILTDPVKNVLTKEIVENPFTIQEDLTGITQNQIGIVTSAGGIIFRIKVKMDISADSPRLFSIIPFNTY